MCTYQKHKSSRLLYRPVASRAGGLGGALAPPPVFGQTEGQIIPNIVLQATPRIFRRCDGPVINHITSNLMKFHGYDRSSALVLDIFYETHFLAYCPWSLKVRGHKSLSRRCLCLLRSLTNTWWHLTIFGLDS